ncbi:SpaA isopeptide-forming pilin-related protein [Streptomyces sp. NPDC001941]|uniref:SpaA isopeptide-forming pilin-related protein n=1 Tax=Streptomyces sp. NPDC001941 TaxID=3154659 RepID=UPI00331FCEDB
MPLVASSLGLAAAPWAHAADAGDGSVKVRVVREVNANGRWDSVLEPGMNQVEVRLTDDAGTTLTGKTGPDGTVTFNPATASPSLKGGKYRVQVMNPRPGTLFSAFADHQGLLRANPTYLTSTEEFVDLTGGNNVEFTTAFWNPSDYCQKNAPLATACHRRDVKEGPADPDSHTLVTFPYNARGYKDQTTVLAQHTQTGTVYGIGYSKQKKWIFSGAFARRGSGYGPDGAGAIYLTDRATGQTTLFAQVPNAGSTAHQIATDQDLPFAPAVNKESLGDIDVSDDGKYLYAINLNDKKLYRYDATQKTGASPESWDIPSANCSNATDWRPGAIGFNSDTGTVYVGGVCSGESSQNRDDMRAVVQTFDPVAKSFTGTILNDRLDYPKQVADTVAGGCFGGAWYPWSDRWRAKQVQYHLPSQPEHTCPPGTRTSYPQPFMGDIIQEINGDLVLGFRDRYADMGGWPMYDRNDAGARFNDYRASGGDIVRACVVGENRYQMDPNGACKNNSTDARVREYYSGDTRAGYHPEAAFAGMALSKVEETIATSGVDPNNATYTTGTMFINRTTGAGDGGNGQAITFGKGSGMADLEVLCDEAPIQIGNRVWYDVDKDGIQDPGEKPVPGATVNLYDKNGTLVATTRTTSRGEYYFDNSNVPGGLKFETQYTIKIDNPADYQQGGPLYEWTVTKNDAGTNDFIDSDGKVPAGGKYPEHTITTGKAGQDNHTYDFGYNQVKPDIDIVKKDEATNSDANTEDTKVVLPDTKEKTLYMDITNNGTEPLVKVEVGDIVTKGDAKIKDLKCNWPDGTSSSDPTGAKVRWDNTFATPPDKPKSRFAVGATYKCTATLYNLKPGVLHGDNSRVDGEGEFSGKAVKDEDPWHGEPLAGLNVVKIDAKTKQPIAGAEFQLWKETNGTDGLQMDGTTPDTKVGTPLTTGANGVATVQKLELGTYYWQETKAPKDKDGKDYPLPKNPVFGPIVLTKDNAESGASLTVENAQPDIDIKKKDEETNSDANTEAEKVKIPDTREKTLYMDITNNGTERLFKIEVGDVILKGDAKIKDLKCNWPDGTSSTDPSGQKVRWDATWPANPSDPKSKPAKYFEIGATYKCTATLYNLKPGVLHTDETTVEGEGEFSGKSVKDKDPWNGEPQASLKVLKVDAKTKQPLAGAVFQLWRETNGTDGLQMTGATPDTKVGGEITTGADGLATAEKLELGTYYWQEVKEADPKYAKPLNPIFGPIVLTKDNAAQGGQITVENHKPEIDIVKKDEATNSDANTEADRVILPDTREKVLYMDITNNGTEPLVKIEVGDVVTRGDAKIKDLKCNWPDGTSSTDPSGQKVRWDNTWFTKPDKPKSRFEVGATYKCTALLYNLKAGEIHGDNSTVDGEGAISERSVKDEDPWHGEPPAGDVKVLKIDAKSKKPLAGAKFQLWRETNKVDGLQMTGATPDTKVGGEVTTGADGNAAVAKVEYGTYYWQETAAPGGYALPDPAVFGPLVLSKENATAGAQATVENAPNEITVVGRIRVLKTDAKTKKPLGGAEFQLWRETNGTAGLQMAGPLADTRVGTPITTGSDGIAEVNTSVLGTYYWQETKAPKRPDGKEYALPKPPVFGPLELTAANAAAGVTVTVENHLPDIDIEKEDKATGKDADTDKDKVIAPDTRTRTISYTVTNNGTEPGIKVEVQDRVTRGKAKVSNLRCFWPDGTTSFDPSGRYVRWNNTWPVGTAKPRTRFAVGASYKCTSLLTGLQAGEVHKDDSRVDMEGEISGKHVDDKDPLIVKPPARISILKRDAKTGKPLMGAVFELWRETNGIRGYQPSDTRVGRGKATDGKGAVSFKIPRAGTYYLYERSVPGGYQLPRKRSFGPYVVRENTRYDAVVRLTNKPHENHKKK